MSETDPRPRLAATIVLLREAPAALEVFMVTRHAKSRFLGGALVFPGGAMDPGDSPIEGGALPGGPAQDACLRFTALRELFEETGFLLALSKETGRPVSPEIAAELTARHRPAIASGEMSFGRMLDEAQLTPDLSPLVPFARWITVRGMPQRFDTVFYAAPAPLDQLGQHDGTELVASRWVTPAQALEEADRALVQVVLPTRANLMLLAPFQTTAAALAHLAGRDLTPVEGVIEEEAGVKMVRIPASAGYPITSAPL